MSRSIPALLSLTLLVACHAPMPRSLVVRGQVPPPIEAVEAGLVGFDRGGAVDAAAADATVVLEPTVIAVDPVVIELLKSAFRSYTQRRRAILENIANVHTPAFKKRVVLTRTRAVRGSNDTPVPIPMHLGTAPVFTPGALEGSERPLDVAIDGDGFFAVTLPDGSTGYTRAGNFHINADGKVVTTDGLVLNPEITICSDTLELSIDPTGLFSGRTAGSPDTDTIFGQLTLHRFINPSGMRQINALTWGPTEASGAPTTAQPGLSGCGLLKQGFLEASNVQLELELLDLQALERQHQVLTKVLRQFGMIAP